MKRVITISLLVFFCVAGLFSQSEWEGRVARGGSQDFPTEGFYAASNSFPRNSIVSVTNPATGKTVRVVVSRGLSEGSLFMTLSGDAARSLGLDGSFPATMKAQPVVIPGVSDQSVGSELPFAQDPDINPSASAGDPNAFVFNNQANAQDIRPPRADNQTGVIQPPSSSVVQSNGQAASSRTLVVTTTTLPSNAANLSPAVTVPVSTASSDVDLSNSSLIGLPSDTLPSEIVTRNAKIAGSEPPLAKIEGGQAANAATLQATQPIQVPKSDAEPVQAPVLAGQAASSSTTDRSNPASTAPLEMARNTAINLSPASTVPVNAAKATVPGKDNLVNGSRSAGSPALATIAPGSVATDSSQNPNNIQPRTASGIAASVQDLRNRQGINGSTETTVPNRTSAIQSGIRPSNALVEAAKGERSVPSQTSNPSTNQVSVPGGKGIDRGIRSMGANNEVGTGIGDVARPEHLFVAPSANSGINTLPTVAVPQVKNQTNSAAISDQTLPAGSGKSLLDRQLAGINSRDTNPNLFTGPVKDGDRAMLPSVANRTPTTVAPLNSIPSSTVPAVDKPDPSLASARSGIVAGFQGNLPQANTPGVSRADGALPGVVAPNGTVPDGQLSSAQVPGKPVGDPSIARSNAATQKFSNLDVPLANVPGQSLPEVSNPWLEGSANVAGTQPALPIAQLFPDQVPQASFSGSAPGLALIPEKSDLPLVVLKISPQQAEVGFNSLQAGTSTTQKTDLPIAGTKAAGTAEAGLNSPQANDPLAQSGDLPLAGTKAAGAAETGLAAVQPVQTVVSLEPADYRPPQIKNQTPASDALAGQTPHANGSVADATLAEAKVANAAKADSSLAAGTPATTPGTEPELAVVNAPAQLSSEALLTAMRPNDDTGNINLTEATRKVPDVSKPGTVPATNTNDAALTQAKDPKVHTAETSISATNPDNGQTPSTLAQAKSPDAENLLPGQTIKPGDTTKIAVTPVQPNLHQNNTANNNAVAANTTTTTTLAPANQNTTNSEAQRILALLNQANPQTTKIVPPVANTTVPTGTDELWAQKNLPVIKNLQRNQYYLQVGAFANPHSAKHAIDESVPNGYKIAVLPEKSAKQQVYKVFVGPIKEDEKGLLLYLFRAKGYRDAFIQKGQP